MNEATKCLNPVLEHHGADGPDNERKGNWRTSQDFLLKEQSDWFSSGAINLASAWFAQGHIVSVPLTCFG